MCESLNLLQERITNTEHLVSLDLDGKRNALVAMQVGSRYGWLGWVLGAGWLRLGAGAVGLRCAAVRCGR